MNRPFTRVHPALLILVGLALTVVSVYNNCSQVDFTPTPEGKKLLDQQAAEEIPTVEINNDDPYTKVRQVSLKLHAGISNAKQMWISNDSDCNSGAWETYQESRIWDLSKTNQEVHVYAKYRSDEDETGCVLDAIVHDDIPPMVSFSKSSGKVVANRTYDVAYQLIDSGSGVKDSMCRVPGSNAFAACPPNINSVAAADGAQAVLIRASDKAGNMSEIYSHEWIVDTTGPVILLTRTPSQLTPDTQAKFEFAATDVTSSVKSIQCRVDGSAWASCSSPFIKNVVAGPHSFEVQAFDVVDNASAIVKYDWTVDPDAPRVEILTAPAPYINVTQAQVTFRGDDGGVPLTVFECRVDQGAMASCTTPYNIMNMTDGVHKFEVRGQDSAGNWSGTASASWMVDTLAPTIVIVSGPNAYSNSTSAQLQMTAADSGSGVARIECRIDSAAFATCTSSMAYTGLTNGNHAFQARSVDRAGNVSAVATHNWMVDTGAPTVTITSGPTGLVGTGDASFTFTGTDTLSGIVRYDCQLDNSGYQPCTSPKNYAGQLEGTHTFYVRSVDRAGNMSAVASRSWTVDLSGPAIVFQKSPQNILKGKSTSALFTASDNLSGIKSVSCKVNGVDTPCQSGVELVLPGPQIATYVLEVRAENNLGLVSNAVRSWNVTLTLDDKTRVVTIMDNRPVDVLVVLDNSGSMDMERRSMATRFSGFVNKLTGIDWRLAITTTDVTTGGSNSGYKDGRLLKFRNFATDRYFIDPTVDPMEAQVSFGDTITLAPGGNGNEQGIRATYRALERSFETNVSSSAPNREFFRANAHLSVILLSDEDETGTGTRNMPDNLLSYINSKWNGQKNLTFHSIIIRPDDQVCLDAAGSGEEKYGYRYDEMSRKTGFGLPGGAIIGSVCATDYTAQLAAIGQSVQDQQKSVNLECEPWDVDENGTADITIMYRASTANPFAPVNLAYTSQGVKVSFENILAVGEYQFLYKCLSPVQ